MQAHPLHPKLAMGKASAKLLHSPPLLSASSSPTGFLLAECVHKWLLKPQFSGVHLQTGCRNGFLAQFLIQPKSQGRTLSGLLGFCDHPSASLPID